jgi:outer membrane protein assembly factor BamB
MVSTALPGLSLAGVDIEPTRLEGDLLPASLFKQYVEDEPTGIEPEELEDSWPMFRHDLNHTGYSTSQVPDDPSVSWTFQAVNGFESSPVVAYGMVFIGSENRNIYAVREDSGELVWNFTVEKQVRATPAVADGKIFVGSSKFYALDAFTGSLIWTFERHLKMGDKSSYGSSPAVDAAEGRIYTGAKITNDDLDTKHQEFFCLNMTTGESIWTLTEPHGAGQRSSPAVSGDAVFISLGERVLSLDKRTGLLLWEFPMSDISKSSPTVANDTVFIQSMRSGSFFAIDKETGSLKWKYDQPYLGGSSDPSPAYNNGIVFVGSWDHNVYAFDAGTGKVLWRYKTGNLVASSLAVADGKIIITSMDGFLYVLDENHGSLIWKFDLGRHHPISSPAVSGGRIFVTDDVRPDEMGTLFAFGSPPRSITLNVDPDTLNLNSRGRWITAYITTENAMAEDIDPSSLVLNDIIPPAWWNVQNEMTLMVKFDRAAVQAILPVSNVVDIKVTGQWKDAETFEGHDIIRVIDVGGPMESPWPVRFRDHVYPASEYDSLLVLGSLPSASDLTLRVDLHIIEISVPVREEQAPAASVGSERW